MDIIDSHGEPDWPALVNHVGVHPATHWLRNQSAQQYVT